MPTPLKGNARSSGYERNANDWYVEPRVAIDMLLDKETFIGDIWDPACGGGNIPEACKARDYWAFGTDIVDRGYGRQLDFLCEHTTVCSNVVSNPPYNVAEQFVKRGLDVTTRKVAVLVRTAFLEGQGRYSRLFKPSPPARVWQFVPRISMPPGGSDVPAKGGSVAFCWVVWDKGHKGPPEFGWLS